MAAPNIKERFGTQERFLSMVREGYKPVYRPQSYAMGDIEESHVGLTQHVQIQDAEGVDWTAVYTVERQPDGSWKITGCYLIKAPGERACSRGAPQAAASLLPVRPGNASRSARLTTLPLALRGSGSALKVTLSGTL